MDQFLLRAVAEESATRLVEQEVLRVSCLGGSRYVIRFATAGRDNLLLSARPDLPRLHLLSHATRVHEVPPDRFAALLDQEIGGSVVAEIRVEPWDRIVRLRLRLPRRDDGAQERTVLVELCGRSANVLLLNESGLMLGYARQVRSELRTPAIGTTYQPPRGRERYANLPSGAAALPLVRQRFSSPVEFLHDLCPVLARDLETIAAADHRAADARLEEILTATGAGRWFPVVYSVLPLTALGEGDTLGRDDLIVSPLPLRFPPRHCAGGEPLITSAFASPSEAAEAVFGLLERQRDFRAVRDHHQALVAREIDRLGVLTRKLQEELRRAGECDRHRVMAEAILAGLSAAQVDGKVARVPDPYDPSGAVIEVPIDPSLSLQDNAQVLFGRYKKGKRGQRTIEARLPAVEARRRSWAALQEPARNVHTPHDLDHLREAMGRLGLVHAPRPKKGGPPALKHQDPARVRRHESSDGFVILVGKSGPENDTLTFRVASPWDFWLHAAGQSGAHVVVRNPRRLAALPEPTLRAAAEIAAYYSGARQDNKVEVHYTQRKHVHKRKGMPSGQVLVRRFRTVQVTPRLPVPAVEEV